MSRSSIRYIDTTYIYGQQPVTAPVTSPVIYGRFPKHVSKKSPSERLNKLLSMLLLALVVVSVVSYYFVSDSERRLNNIGREITKLSSENLELQNTIDNMHSFNKVDTVIHQKTMLDTAKKVIEIPVVKIASAPELSEKDISYKWSIGY